MDMLLCKLLYSKDVPLQSTNKILRNSMIILDPHSTENIERINHTDCQKTYLFLCIVVISSSCKYLPNDLTPLRIGKLMVSFFYHIPTVLFLIWISATQKQKDFKWWIQLLLNAFILTYLSHQEEIQVWKYGAQVESFCSLKIFHEVFWLSKTFSHSYHQ